MKDLDKFKTALKRKKIQRIESNLGNIEHINGYFIGQHKNKNNLKEGICFTTTLFSFST